MEKNKISGIVLGLGLNVNLKKETIEQIDQKATSIGYLTGQIQNVEKILKNICDEFFENYDSFIKEGFEYIQDDYIRRCNFLGKNISIREAQEKRNYFAKSIDRDGLLIAIDEQDRECKIITGDVLC